MARKDDIIWRFDKKGFYSVKSAYRVCVDVLINRDEWKVEGDWNKLWNRPIPPKVKHFMWRLGRNCLPNRQRLSSKGVDCQENCVVCQYLIPNKVQQIPYQNSSKSARQSGLLLLVVIVNATLMRAAMSTADGKVSMGACVHDENGHFISAMTNVLKLKLVVSYKASNGLNIKAIKM
ncbi:pentatricopeptide repeat-containing protein [Trifolium pratense]|uniref:Pentatricopeptide repeat-containing protein n=1 Tax=Trifolium pratense TaxID=57577 RepID=A0A2K3MVH4_TRIPR|nr:pentatricopeptide repeat-containing protein [Trifolium pratense]